jgi:hypothetical protein
MILIARGNIYQDSWIVLCGSAIQDLLLTSPVA